MQLVSSKDVKDTLRTGVSESLYGTCCLFPGRKQMHGMLNTPLNILPLTGFIGNKLKYIIGTV